MARSSVNFSISQLISGFNINESTRQKNLLKITNIDLLINVTLSFSKE